MKLLGLIDQSEQLSVLLNFHYIVKDTLHTTISTSVDASHIEIDDLNDMTMLGFMWHLHLIQEHRQYLLFVCTLPLSFLDLLIHYLDGDSLLGLNIDGHFNSK